MGILQCKPPSVMPGSSGIACASPLHGLGAMVCPDPLDGASEFRPGLTNCGRGPRQ